MGPHSLILPSPKFSVTLEKKPYRHYYVIEHDVRLPGVTTILDQTIAKPALGPWMKRMALDSARAALLANKFNPSHDGYIGWVEDVIKTASKEPDKIKDEAASAGTDIHAIIDRIWLGGEAGDIPEAYQPAVSAFLDWKSKYGLTPVLGDTPVASIEYGFAGSADALAIKDDRFVLLDWKTSNNIYVPYFFQCAAYCRGFLERFDIKVTEAWIVRFSKTLPVEFQAEKVPDIELAFNGFLATKKVRDAMKHLEDLRHG